MKRLQIFSLLFIPMFGIAQVRTVVYQNDNDLFRARPEFKMDSRSITSREMPSFDVQRG